MRVIGSLHSDNAGEFLSHEFEELLDSELIHHTTCPPHVHQLNGVAERSVRSIMDLVRTYLAASGLPPSFWEYAAVHAVDVLNRTTTPPDSKATCYEELTGEKPKIMSIMPFGCRAFAVKPDSAIRKTSIDLRAWVGINLGRSSTVLGAYNVWCPDAGRVVCTSEVYFAESYFPARPKGTHHVGRDAPQRAFADETQPPGVPRATRGPAAPLGEPRAPSTAPPPSQRRGPTIAPSSMRGGLDAAVRRRASAANSRTVLLLFSGP